MSSTIEERIESSKELKCFTLYFKFLLHPLGRGSILLFWLSIIIIGIFYGWDFLNQTIFEFSAPANTPGYTSDKYFNYYFPSTSNDRQLIALFEFNSANSTCKIMDDCSPMNAMSKELNAFLIAYGSPFTQYLDYNQALYAYGIRNSNYMKETAKEIYTNCPSCSASIGIIIYDNTLNNKMVDDFINDVNAECNKINNNDEYHHSTPYVHTVSVSLTGQKPLINAMNTESKKDVQTKDTLTIPLALLVLAFIIRSWRLMFIPLLTFGTSICASFSIMKPFAMHVLNINPFTPSIMMSVSIAMSIDYSLFLLSRFREEIEKYDKRHKFNQLNVEQKRIFIILAIRQMIRWSGKVVALSGFILACTYCGLILYPMVILQSVGLGASIAILCTIATNLTITPALLLFFPHFFSQFGWAGCPWNKSNIDTSVHLISDDIKDNEIHPQLIIQAHDQLSKKSYDDIFADDSSIESLDSDTHSDDTLDDINTKCDQFWYRCGSQVTQSPKNIIIIIIVFICISPIGWNVFNITKQLSDTLIFPTDSHYLTTLNAVQSHFTSGTLSPWYIIIPNHPSTIINNTIFNDIYMYDTGTLIEQLHHQLFNKGYYVSITGIAYFGAISNNAIIGSIITYDEYYNFTTHNSSDAKYRRYPYTYITDHKVNEDMHVSYYTMISDFDPYYTHAIQFVSDARSILNTICIEYECYFSGGSVDEVDNVNKIFDNFPAILGIIVSIVFCMVGVIFRSVFVPFRLFITITIPMTFVYGLAILVYQNGILSGMKMDAFANTDGLYWIIPIMTVTILIGLALDYDIFLYARIYEYRVVGGLSTRRAVVRGVYKTGAIITAAGCIMSIAFCGLLMSNITSLNQTGFIMVVAVLVDTFIIRTVLVPAVLSLAGEVNWWPGLRFVVKEKMGIRLSSDVRDGFVEATLDELM